jgi:hypothetical protein
MIHLALEFASFLFLAYIAILAVSIALSVAGLVSGPILVRITRLRWTQRLAEWLVSATRS